MLYKTAKQHATDICEQLRPLCYRAEPVGSIRRHEPLCDDIDIVCECTDKQRAAVRARCLQSHPEIRADGDQILSIVLSNGIRVQINYAKATTNDLFTEIPTNWGSIMLLRTGPKEFCQTVAVHAGAKGLHWQPFEGIYQRNTLIASRTEEDIFKALGLKYIPPRIRNSIHLPGLLAA